MHMKRFSLPVAALLLVSTWLLISTLGCDGDGDNSNNGNGQTPSPPAAPVTVTLADGTTFAPPGSTFLAELPVNETGTLTATVTWGGQPASLGVTLFHLTAGDVGGLTATGTPVTHTVTVTDTHVASAPYWRLRVVNPIPPGVTVIYTVTFTPD
jgi:hypothetical protein